MKYFLTFAALLQAPLAALHAAAERLPNVLLIVADDMSYADINIPEVLILL